MPSTLKKLAEGGYLKSTKTKPNPDVGTRYDVSDAYGMAPKTPVDLEQHKGASMLVLPYDSTSRNVDVRGVSGRKLLSPVTTHGGQDYARDLENILRGIAGASSMDITKKIATREGLARIENERAGGTGSILHLPITMGDRAEDFSMSPSEVIHQFVQMANLPKREINRMNQEIRAHAIVRAKKRIQPFGNFVGLEHPEFSRQLETGEGLGTTAGELRKAIVNRLGYKKQNQKALGFNMEDIVGAVTDPALRGVPKGFIGNAVVGSDPDGMTLTPSRMKAYSTDTSGKYLGTLGRSFPAEVLFGNQMNSLQNEFEGKTGDMRNMTLGALEKRNNGVSQMLDNETLDKYGAYMRRLDRYTKRGAYAEGGEVAPTQDQMLAHIMLHKAEGGMVDDPYGGAPDTPDGNSSDLGFYEGGPGDTPDTNPLQYLADGGSVGINDIGVNEAPNMDVKVYMPPSDPTSENSMPVGGVDFQPLQPGQQVAAAQPQGQIGQPPAPQGQPGQPQAPQGMPQMSQPPQGMPPTGGAAAPVGARSNLLQLTAQGKALSAMQPVGMKQMAKGGAVKLTTAQMRESLRKKAAGGSIQSIKLTEQKL